MKKFLIFLTILFSLIFSDIVLADNVSAKTVSINDDTFKHFVQPLRDDMKTIRTTILSNLNYDSYTQDYFCIFNTLSGNPYGTCFTYNKSFNLSPASNYVLRGSVIFSNLMLLNNDSNLLSYGLYNSTTETNGEWFTPLYGYNSSGSYTYSTTSKRFINFNLFNVDSTDYTLSNDNYFINSASVITRWTWLESSTDFKFISHDINYSSDILFNQLDVYDSNFTDLINSYLPNDNLFNNQVDFIPSFVPPTFAFGLTENRDSFNRLTSVDIRLAISNYNDDMIIQYITGDTSGTWTTILPEYNEVGDDYYFTWDNWTLNTTIFVRAIFNNEVVSSATQEIVGIIPTYDSGQVNNFGNYSFGVTSDEVTISGENLFNNIVCSRDRSFVNNVCYVNNSDILNVDNKLSNKIHAKFMFSMDNVNVPYLPNKYYLLSYRSYFDKVYLPFNVSIISGGLIESTTSIIDYNIKEHGLYRDYIIMFSSSSSANSLAVDGVNLDFPNLSSIYSTFPDDFTIGFYSGVKYQQYDSQPTLSDIESFYNNNSLDTLNNESLLSYFSNFNVNDHGLSSIILKPLDFVDNLLVGTCSPIVIPLPHTDKTLSLPCIRSMFELHLPSIFSIYQIIVSGLICYRIGLDLFRIIKNMFSPDDDKIEVIDL